jgi:hypothetical protein
MMAKRRLGSASMALSGVVIVLWGSLASGCASPPPAAQAGAKEPLAAKPKAGLPPRPADAEADVAYYRERATALATEVADEIARTDFTRLRRGRLYVPDAPNTRELEERLADAIQSESFAGIADASAAILASDQAEIHAHFWRAAALRKAGQITQADFHRAAAQALLDSIARTGDGRSTHSAVVVYRVKEEYEILKAMRARFTSQALISAGGHSFDVLDAVQEDGGKVRVYFAIDELLAEEARAFQGP